MFRMIVCFFLLFNLIFLESPAVYAQSQLVDRPKRELFEFIKITEMRPDSRELAEQLEILPLLEELYDKKSPVTPERQAILRSKIQETIIESYFDAASVQAEANREQSRLQSYQEILTSKRDRSVNYNNATNFIASGTLNTIGSALGFTTDANPFPGNFNQMMSGVVAMGMSTYSLKQSGGGKLRGRAHPTMVAELFGRPTSPDTTYPESVWRFFHGKSPGEPTLTRVQVLERDWIARDHLERHGSKREREKIDLMCGIDRRNRGVTIDDLEDLITILADISMVAELMTHQLRDLMRMIDSDLDLSKF